MITDRAQRERALDPARSFIVQAPAGSGKTTLLVERFLVLLKNAKRPEEVVAITFTRKAAAEMRKRVLQRLDDAGEIAHRLRIETIDAFCMSLARQLPVPAQFGVPPGIVEDAAELYREAAARTLGLLEGAEHGAKVARLLAHLDNNVASATALLARMLEKRDQWLRKTGRAPTREELERSLAQERSRLIGKARALDPRASEDFARQVLTDKNTYRKRDAVAQALDGNEPLRLALAQLKTLPPEKYTDAQWEALEAMLALLPVAAAQLKLVFAQRGEADFTEIAQGAVRALGTVDDPSDLLLALDQKIQHLLVDEFQDTSISQWELLERLTAGWQEGDGRSLFVVGDPMQSIYRFREAEVGLFLKARREGLPNVRLESLALETNFRSQAKLVDFFNATFAEVLPKEADEASGAVPYSKAAASHPALAGDAARWHCAASVEEEARIVAGLAKAAGEGGGTTALLVRNRNALAAIVPALKDAGIRFRAIEIETLDEKQVVQDLFALTRALTHLADRVAWLALLRAPWVGLTLEELALHFENKPGVVWDLLPDGPRFARFREVIGEALAQTHRGTLRARVERAWLALGGPACVPDATALEDAGAYLDALEALEDAGEVDFARLEEALEELYARPDAGATERDLQIMTIHKAKGLEFDTVIVPGLHRPPRSGESPLMRWKELPDASLLLAPIKETGGEDEPAYEYLKQLDREAEDTEAARLLYVAATRAVSRLHLLAVGKADKDGNLRPPAKRSLLAAAWSVAAPHFPATLPPPPAERERQRPPQTLIRLAPGFQLPAPPPPVAWTPPTPAQEEEPIEFSWAGETARHVGTIVHRWLQRIAEDELKGWDAARVESLRSRIEIDIVKRGVKAPGPAVELVVTALKNTLGDERGQWILGAHPEARSEYRFRTSAGRYVADRVLRDRDGIVWIIDFKTSRHEGSDISEFLRREQGRYAPQLEKYASVLVDRRGGELGLYFPMLRGWVQWRHAPVPRP